MIKTFSFPNYIYNCSKPKKNQGDSSIDSDFFKSIDEETVKEKSLLKKKNKLFIPRVIKKTHLKNSKKKKDFIPQKALKLTPHSSTKDTDTNRKSSKNSFKNLDKEKESFLNIINKTNNNKENNRYKNCFNKVSKRNLRFLSCLKDEESDYDENIIDNEISVNFIEGFNFKSKKIKEEQVEIPLENISRINTNSEISNGNIKSLIKDINLMKKSKRDFEIDKYIIEDKENFCPNKQYDKEIKIDLKEINKNNNIIYLDKSKSMKRNTKNLNNKYFDLKKSQKSFGNINKNNQKNSFIKFNLTKKYKIFQKFLSIGIDTSGLYTLDDEMFEFILNPKITYNFPFNNSENELE